MPEIEPEASGNVTLTRLEEQLSWYSRKSRSANKRFKAIKVTEILAAAFIPFLGSLPFQGLKPHLVLITGALGVLITVLEGIEHLNQYQQSWSSYRATAEALKHEKFLYLAGAGVYADDPKPLVQLAERVEALVSQENAAWASLQLQRAKDRTS